MPSGLSPELHQPGTVKAVNAVIFAEMAGQGPQISLRGDPFWILADFAGSDLAALDRHTGVEQRFDSFQPLFRLQRTDAVDQSAPGLEHVDGRPQ
jgi:hypothetical protein